MSDAFPTTGIFRRGYGKDAVDDFFAPTRIALLTQSPELATMLSKSMIFWIGSLPSSMIVRNFWLTMFAMPYSRPHAARKHMRWVQLTPISAVQSRSFSP